MLDDQLIEFSELFVTILEAQERLRLEGRAHLLQAEDRKFYDDLEVIACRLRVLYCGQVHQL